MMSFTRFISTSMLACFVIGLAPTAAQVVTGSEIKVTHSTLGDNGDAIRFSRADVATDYGRLRLALGDEESTDFEIGYNLYTNSQWTPAFSFDGFGNFWAKNRVSTSKLGVGTSSPAADIHIYSTTASTWLAIDKPFNYEGGIQFRRSGAIQFYLFSDNVDNDALKLMSAGLAGEDDNNPRIQIPFTNKNIYMAQSGGNVAIGHNNPYSHSRLHVKSPSASPWGILTEASNNGNIIGLGHDGNFGYISTSYLGSGGYSPLSLRTSNQARLTITTDGNVGIGTTTPDKILTVNGTIHAEEVLIEVAVPAPDYVFEKNYNLISLEEVKTYIDQNKHLPEVPSASEIEKNGLKVGEMEMILLKKIEELTLHLIEKNEQLKQLQQRLEVLEKK